MLLFSYNDIETEDCQEKNERSERMLKKMRSVFGIFQEARDDVALLWRPHPLIEATINSMWPHLQEEYREVVEE